jgi:ATPase family associated with various cellular activities (AAA)
MTSIDESERSGAISPERYADTAHAIIEEIGKVIVGQHDLVRQVIVCLLCEGHALLEGVPGLGKTELLKTLARVVDLHFGRIQFTPDLMPADILGTQVLEEDHEGRRRFHFRAGPIFANLVLADEVNRATPKTQSALLEAMQERAATVAGQTRALDRPFFVMATQNPLEMEGTYPLPEAQLDRFLLKVLVPFPSSDELVAVVNRTTGTRAVELRRSRRISWPTPSTSLSPRTPSAPACPSWCRAMCGSARRRVARRRLCWRPRPPRCSTAGPTWRPKTCAPSPPQCCATASCSATRQRPMP